MLPGQQGRRADQRHLVTRHRGDEGGAKRDLGLAETDIAADQPVHRLAALQILQHLADRAVLVVGLLIGKAVDELGIGRVVGFRDLARASGANRRRS